MVANFYDSSGRADWLCRWVQCEDCVASLFWAPPIEVNRRTPPLRVRVRVVERHMLFAPHPNLRQVHSVFRRWASACPLVDVLEGRARALKACSCGGGGNRCSHCDRALTRGVRGMHLRTNGYG